MKIKNIGTPLPAEATFEVPLNPAQEVLVRLYRGESAELDTVTFVGAFSHEADAGVATVKLTVDQDGLLAVTVQEPGREARRIRVSMLDGP